MPISYDPNGPAFRKPIGPGGIRPDPNAPEKGLPGQPRRPGITRSPSMPWPPWNPQNKPWYGNQPQAKQVEPAMGRSNMPSAYLTGLFENMKNMSEEERRAYFGNLQQEIASRLSRIDTQRAGGAVLDKAGQRAYDDFAKQLSDITRYMNDEAFAKEVNPYYQAMPGLAAPVQPPPVPAGPQYMQKNVIRPPQGQPPTGSRMGTPQVPIEQRQMTGDVFGRTPTQARMAMMYPGSTPQGQAAQALKWRKRADGTLEYIG